MNDQQAEAAAIQFVRSKSRRDLNLAESKEAVVRIGDAEGILILVCDRILAARGNHQVIHAVAIEIGHELRRTRHQRAVLAKLLVHEFISHRRRRRLGARRRWKRLLLGLCDCS